MTAERRPFPVPQIRPESEEDAAGFETRIDVYRERGYFPAEDVHVPERALGNSVRRYRDGPRQARLRRVRPVRRSAGRLSR